MLYVYAAAAEALLFVVGFQFWEDWEINLYIKAEEWTKSPRDL